MNTNILKLETLVSITCCGQTWSSRWRAEVIHNIYLHLLEKHPEVEKRLELEGRKLSRFQNGWGYYDDGKSSNLGWQKASPKFREEWKKHALSELLDNGEIKV